MRIVTPRSSIRIQRGRNKRNPTPEEAQQLFWAALENLGGVTRVRVAELQIGSNKATLALVELVEYEKT